MVCLSSASVALLTLATCLKEYHLVEETAVAETVLARARAAVREVYMVMIEIEFGKVC